MKRQTKQPIPMPIEDDFYEARFNAPMSKRLKAFRLLEQYIFQQRKRSIVIFTNDAEMKKLFEKAYPNVTVTVLRAKNSPPYFEHYNSKEIIKKETV